MDASGELISKLSRGWDPLIYGPLLYTIAYAAAGNYIELFFIRADHTIHSIMERIDMIQPFGKGRLLCAVMNLVRVLEAFVKFWPEDLRGGPPFYSDIARSDEVTLKYSDCFVEKCYSRTSPQEQIRTIYTDVQRISGAARNLHMIRVSKIRQKKGELAVELNPLGMQRLPRNATELKSALHAVLTALSHWHAAGWRHGDIRWPNILFVPTKIMRTPPYTLDGYWMLIDFDHSQQTDVVIDWNHPFNDEPLTFLIDLKQVQQLVHAELFGGIEGLESEDAFDFANKDFETATEMLNHPFLSNLV
jgi:hypothetical protein